MILKFVADPAWERAVREDLSNASFTEFQPARAPGGRAGPRDAMATRLVGASRDRGGDAESAAVARVLANWRGRDDVVTVPNGVRASQRTESTGWSSRLRLLFVGRLVSVKRVDLVIAAVAAVDDVTLDIVGDGPERDALVDDVARPGSNRV